MHSIDNIRVLAQLCRSRQPLPESLSAWLANSLQSFLDQRVPSLNDAFGIRNARGGIPWRVEASNRARDAALRTLAMHFLCDLSISAQAKRIHQMTVRYAAGNWRFDRDCEAMPPGYAGQAQEYIWRAFKSGATMPLCTRQLRTILAS